VVVYQAADAIFEQYNLEVDEEAVRDVQEAEMG